MQNHRGPNRDHHKAESRKCASYFGKGRGAGPEIWIRASGQRSSGRLSAAVALGAGRHGLLLQQLPLRLQNDIHLLSRNYFFLSILWGTLLWPFGITGNSVDEGLGITRKLTLSTFKIRPLSTVLYLPILSSLLKVTTEPTLLCSKVCEWIVREACLFPGDPTVTPFFCLACLRREHTGSLVSKHLT